MSAKNGAGTIRLNPTSPLRSGFAYQDLWAIKLCAEWLAMPDKYKWLKFETVPDGISANKFKLDDIVLFDSNDLYVLVQVKHRQDRNSAWTWDELLKIQDSGSSILAGWYKSFTELNSIGKIGSASFVTNGIASKEISDFIAGGRIDFGELKSQNPSLAQSIIDQFGKDDIAVNDFFGIFSFNFGEENIDRLEARVRKSFSENLRATKSGIDSLFLTVQAEARKRITEKILCEQLRSWCEFDIPKELPQKFEIPNDFEFFDSKLHQDFLRDISTPDGGVRVVTGNPGSGKSVYLSKLDEILTAAGVISIKHHYHLSPEDERGQERLGAERAVEAIKAQIKHYEELVGDLANKNSSGILLSEYFAAIAATLHSKGRAAVLIIDGLDHVPRYESAKELTNFLRQVAFPQKGLWIILGTQRVAKPYLPQIFLDKCPEKDWMEISGLSPAAIKRVLVKNDTALKLPADGRQLQKLNDSLVARTQGNPLHLRYLLKQLKIKLGNSLASDIEVASLIPYGGHISKYYEVLWRHLSPLSQTILLAVISVDFIFRKDQLVECASGFEIKPSVVSQSFSEIVHLIKEDRRGRVAAYHNSFQVFLSGTTEYSQQKISLMLAIKKWLSASKHEALKWAELRKLEYETGNPDPILELNKKWVQDAICFPRNVAQISSQLDLAFQAALEKDDFGLAVKFSHLNLYLLNSIDYNEENWSSLFECAVLINESALNDVALRGKPISSLLKIALLADQRGQIEIYEEALELLIEQQGDQEIYQKSDDRSKAPALSMALVRAIACDRTHSVERVHKYILQFERSGWSIELLKAYTEQLLLLGQPTKVLKLLGRNLSAAHLESVITVCAVNQLRRSCDDFLPFSVGGTSQYRCLYLAVKKACADKPELFKEKFSAQGGIGSRSLLISFQGLIAGDTTKLPLYEEIPHRGEDHDSKSRALARAISHDCFLVGLTLGLTEKTKLVQDWIDNAPNEWLPKAIAELLKAALKISADIKARKNFEYADFLEAATNTEFLEWPNERRRMGLQYGYSSALTNILSDLIDIKHSLKADASFSPTDVAYVSKSRFIADKDFCDILINREECLLSQTAYTIFSAGLLNHVEEKIYELSNRSQDYLNLSRLCLLQRDTTRASNLLDLGAKNFIGYGYHKDPYLGNVIDAISACSNAGTDDPVVVAWINTVIPLVEYVTEYTDGDGTGYFTLELAELLARKKPTYLYSQYFYSAHTEDLFQAQDYFRYILHSLDYRKDEELGLATTALDMKSLAELRKIAEKRPEAGEVLRIIQQQLGPLVDKIEPEPSSYTGSRGKKDVDVSKVKPEELEVYVKTTDFDGRWTRDEFLLRWLKHWKTTSNLQGAFEALRKLMLEVGLDDFSGDLFDEAQSVAYEFDKELAFEFICRGQARSFGWSAYGSAEEVVLNRWGILKSLFPIRYIEFFKKSIGYEMSTIGSSVSSIPIPRGVNFFLFFNDLKRAKSITAASIDFAQELTADLRLPVPEWFSQVVGGKSVGVLDLLLQRLSWPSPLVRERAAAALGSLITDSSCKDQAYKKLLTYLSAQSLESAAAISLTPFLKAFERKSGPRPTVVKIGEVVAALKVNSLIIEAILKELSLLSGQPLPSSRPLGYGPVSAPPSGYVVDKFFSDHIKTFLPPIYFLNATQIEKNTSKPFIKYWAHNSELLAAAGQVPKNTRVGHFYGGKHSPSLTAMSTNLSEVYRSAFIRVLQKFFVEGLVPEEFYLEYAYHTFPVDLSKWKVGITEVPTWWPQLVDGPSKQSGHILEPVGFKKPIAKLITAPEKGWSLLAAEGAVMPAKGWADDIQHTFCLIAFAYKVLGGDRPTAEAVGKELIYASSAIIPTTATRPLASLEDGAQLMPLGIWPQRLLDLEVYPLLLRPIDLVGGLWQYYRDYHPPWLLNPDLSSEYKLVIEQDSVCYKHGRKKVYVTKDWLAGLRERQDREMPYPYGHYVEMETLALNGYLHANGYRLAYVLKTTFKERKNGFGDVEEVTSYEFINLGSIITKSAPPKIFIPDR